MAVEKKELVGRHKRLAFMDVEGTGTTFIRMTGFTALSEGKEAKEYNRQYVDEATERNDVVGYATSVEYEFDRYTNDKVCEKICTITDDELVGTEAQVDIVTVDVFTAGDNNIVIIAKDNLGKTTTVNRKVRVDTKAPVISDVVAQSTTVDAGGRIKITFKVVDPA